MLYSINNYQPSSKKTISEVEQKVRQNRCTSQLKASHWLRCCKHKHQKNPSGTFKNAFIKAKSQINVTSSFKL